MRYINRSCKRCKRTYIQFWPWHSTKRVCACCASLTNNSAE